MIRNPWRPVAPVLVSLLLAACGGAPAPSSPGASTQPSSSVVASQAPSPSAAVAASPSAAAPAAASPAASGTATLSTGEVAPGAYEAAVAGTRTALDVPSPGWQADARPDGWTLIPSNPSGGVSLVSFDGKVYSDPCSGEATKAVKRSASAFIDWLAANKELKAGKPTETTLAGQPAIQLDVTADVPPACPESPRNWLWVLGESGDFHLDENEAARIIAADIGEQTLVAIVEMFDPADQAAMLEATQPILDSIRVP